MKASILFVLALLLLSSCTRNTRSNYKKPTKAYSEIKKEIKNRKTAYAIRYQEASDVEKKGIVVEVREYLFSKLTNEIFPSWYGTSWDFNGITQVPKAGDIACGYFVTTTLQAASFDIPRVKWAQMASENMIMNATPLVTRFSNASMEEIRAWLSSQEDALYIVGLDNHTGFVCKKGSKITFIHSSPNNELGGVISEAIDSKNPLTESGYRVFGKILHDEMIVKWLTK